MVSACAPSHRMVHEGNVYFERCYGAEFDARVTPELREACWSAWLAHYTRAQPPEHVDYAMRRLEAIQAGDQTLKLPGIPGGQSSAPMDTSAADMTLRGAHVGSEVATTESLPGNPNPPAHGCNEVCADVGAKCQAGCPPDSMDCKVLCVREREICRHGCY